MIWQLSLFTALKIKYMDMDVKVQYSHIITKRINIPWRTKKLYESVITHWKSAKKLSQNSWVLHWMLKMVDLKMLKISIVCFVKTLCSKCGNGYWIWIYWKEQTLLHVLQICIQKNINVEEAGILYNLLQLKMSWGVKK